MLVAAGRIGMSFYYNFRHIVAVFILQKHAQVYGNQTIQLRQTLGLEGAAACFKHQAAVQHNIARLFIHRSRYARAGQLGAQLLHNAGANAQNVGNLRLVVAQLLFLVGQHQLQCVDAVLLVGQIGLLEHNLRQQPLVLSLAFAQFHLGGV